MKKILCLLATVAALGVARAADENFTIALDTAQAGGGLRTGSGDGVLTLRDDNVVTYTLSYTGLPGSRRGVTIYGPSSGGGPGNTAPALYILRNQSSAPGPSDGTIVSFFTLTEGTGGFTVAQQRSQLLLSQWYIGISTAGYPATGDMDLRGTISYNVIPEPGTLSLLALGIAGMALRLRKK